MSISKISYLIELVKVLDKSEKRAFKLQSTKVSTPSDKLYVQLFDLLDKAPEREEAYYKSRLQISNLQYTNLKRHLYSLILKSLRTSHTNKESIFLLKEQSDYAHILFEKGLHKQSLEIVAKLKPTAKKRHETRLLNELIELQKKIESRFITRSRGVKNKMESLIEESEMTGDSLKILNNLSNLCLKIQGLYIKVGYTRDERDLELYKAYFYSNLKHTDRSRLKLIERIYWHQAHVWFHHSCLNFHLSYRHAVSWVESFHKDLSLIQYDYTNYIRGLHYILRQCFYLSSVDRFNHWYAVLEQFRKKNDRHISRVKKMLDFAHYNIIRLNHIIINNKYSQLHNVVKEISSGQEDYGQHLDKHRHYVFSFKIATAYSYTGNYNKAIDYCNDIISHSSDYLKKDIAPYSRLLHIMCHFRLNNFQLVENMVDSIKSEFQHYKQESTAVDLILNFLKKASRAMNFGLDDDITKLHNRLVELRSQQYEKLPFIYYDYINWCQSLLNNTTVEKHIK
ncbi:hypothetical protein N9L92_01330 [Saprospiraceae bacterium]|nr:hypothetical protein [Saprospiraceae bacterium]